MIHVASDAGIRADHETAAYSVTSAGVIAVAELFAAEGAPDGIRANAVCPGDETAGDGRRRGRGVARLRRVGARERRDAQSRRRHRRGDGRSTRAPEPDTPRRRGVDKPRQRLTSATGANKDCAPWNESWLASTDRSTRARRSSGPLTFRMARRLAVVSAANVDAVTSATRGRCRPSTRPTPRRARRRWPRRASISRAAASTASTSKGHGTPADVIVQEAEESGADLIVVGTRGHGSARRAAEVHGLGEHQRGAPRDHATCWSCAERSTALLTA